MRRFRATQLVPIFMIVAGACSGGAETPEAGNAADGDVSPLTREQIQEAAEAMSPEVAESLGIVDTTIRIEPPTPADSLRRIPQVGDTAPALR